MKQRKTLGWLVMGVVVVALALSVAPTFAQTATPPATSTVPQAHKGGFGRGGMMCGQAGLDAAAKALKLTTTELQAQLWGGQTLSGLADKAGVNQAVKDGKITQANADWLIEGITKGYIGGGKGGFGMGFEMGGFEMGGRGGRGHGMGGFGMPKGTTPNGTTPNSSGSTSPSRYTF
jgi:hypothetical protein